MTNYKAIEQDEHEFANRAYAAEHALKVARAELATERDNTDALIGAARKNADEWAARWKALARHTRRLVIRERAGQRWLAGQLARIGAAVGLPGTVTVSAVVDRLATAERARAEAEAGAATWRSLLERALAIPRHIEDCRWRSKKCQRCALVKDVLVARAREKARAAAYDAAVSAGGSGGTR